MKRLKFTILIIFFSIAIPTTLIQAAPAKQTSTTKQNTTISPALKKDLEIIVGYETRVRTIKKRLTSQQRLSINALNIFQSELKKISTKIKVYENRYQTKLKNIKKINDDFAKIKNVSAEKLSNIDSEYDQYYKQKIEEFKTQMTFLQNRIFQIRLIQYDINTLHQLIKKKQIQLRNGTILTPSNQLYVMKTWELGLHGFKTYTTRLIDQTAIALDRFKTAFGQMKFWICLIIFFFILIVYLKVLWPTKNIIKYENVTYRAFRHLVYRGIIPAAFCFFGNAIIKNVMLPHPPIVFVGFTHAVLQSLAFLFLLTATINAVYRYVLSHQHQMRAKPILPVIYWCRNIVLLIFFINNMNFFSIDSYPYPFFPITSVALLNFVLSICLTISLLLLIKRITLVCKEQSCD